jgi:hypothetical protein
LEDVGVEGDPVDDGGDEAGVGDDLAPLAEGQVRRHRHRRFLFAFGEDLEQQLGTSGVEGDVAELVQAEEVQASVAGHDPRQAAFVGGLGELVDQLGGGGVADPPSHDLRLAPPRSFTVSGTSAYILLHRHGRGEVIGRHARLRKGFD